jgi:hypothetical protein
MSAQGVQSLQSFVMASAAPEQLPGVVDTTTKGNSLDEKNSSAVPATEPAAAPVESSSSGNDNDIEQQQDNALARVKTKFGERPKCFKNTFQEVSFVFQATVATATSSFLTGVGMIVTASIGRDLGMTQGEISWITASTSYVCPPTPHPFRLLGSWMSRGSFVRAAFK